MRRIKGLLLVVSLLVGAYFVSSASRLHGQLATPPSLEASTTPAPTYAHYEALFRNLAQIEEHATILDRSTMNGGKSLRDSVCRRITLNLAECARTFAEVKILAARLETLDQQASAIIAAVKNDHKDHKRGALVPPPPPILTYLQQQKKDAIKGTVDSMNIRIGEHGSSALRSFAGTPNQKQSMTTTSTGLPQ